VEDGRHAQGAAKAPEFLPGLGAGGSGGTGGGTSSGATTIRATAAKSSATFSPVIADVSM
jgi:hypothetical protein